MLFPSKGGETLDTLKMKAFETGNPGIPTIYLSHDCRHVLVMTMHRWQGAGLHVAEAEEIERLAQQFNLPELRKALGSP